MEEYFEKYISNAINIQNEKIGEEPIPELPREDQLIWVYCRSVITVKRLRKSW